LIRYQEMRYCAVDVTVDGALGDEQPPFDLLVAQAVCDEARDAGLPFAQGRPVRSFRGGHLTRRRTRRESEGMLGEGSLCLWLLIAGVSNQEWERVAVASSLAGAR
jgi:hypothetical protein